MQPIISSLSLDRMRTAMEPSAGYGEDAATRSPQTGGTPTRDWSVLALSGLVAFLPGSRLRGRQA